ncbi:Ankyrin repeat protein 1 [Giardia duodenalis]|uniref:Ankyrin repeat protein 1 n=1 Tax=Giardia intestinalis (strain ATCC 50803 / WB clone C6) TaxID=184922 RepID=A0A644EZ30_GIAIC|nr:Ankyrin repeat protein 1 [Giardia intestinalis]KAE8301422.1 Ankyrin repeat protein 1 [Giardia intestinalis]
MSKSEELAPPKENAAAAHQEAQVSPILRRALDRLNAARNTLECDVLKLRKIVFQGDVIRLYALESDHLTLENICHSGGVLKNLISDLDVANVAFSILLAIERLSSAGLYLSTIQCSNVFYRAGEIPFLGDIELLLVPEEDHNLSSVVPAVRGLGAAIYRSYAGEYPCLSAELAASDLSSRLSCSSRIASLIQCLLMYTNNQSLSTFQDRLVAEFSSMDENPHTQSICSISSTQADFFRAVETDNLAVVQELGAVFAKSTNETGNTALMMAAKRLSLAVVRILAPFECGEVHSITGNTALHYAMMRSTFQTPKPGTDSSCSYAAFEEFVLAQIIRILAPQEGAVKNAAGELPVSIGISRTYPNSIIRLLLSYSGDIPKAPDTLVESVRNNDIIGVYLNLGQAGRVDTLGNTALAYAIASKSLTCVKLLSTEKDICISSGITPWQLARDSGFMDALTVLEQSPVVDSDGNTQLHRAVMGGDTVGTRLFLSLARKKNNDDYTALMLAAALKHKEIVCLLRNYEAGERDHNGHTALHQSCLHGREEMALLLLEYEKSVLSGAPAEKLTPSSSKDIPSRLLAPGISAAEIAFHMGNLELAKHLLLPEHVVTSPPDKCGRTNLMIGALNGDPFMVFCHLGQVGLVDNDGFTALMHASMHGSLECAVLLASLEAGLAVTTGNRCLSAIDFAVLSGSLNIAEAIAEYELAVPNAEKYPPDMTQLMIAAAEKRPGLVWLYINQANARDSKGWTALMYAVNTGDEDCVKLLLMERDLITEDGVTAWYLAYKVQSPDLCMILRPTYDVDSKGETPLHTYIRFCAQNGSMTRKRADLLAVLHCHGVKNNDGHTALMLAASFGLNDIDQDLLTLEGGIVSTENTEKYGCCASMLALKEGHLETFRLISPFETKALLSCGYTNLMIATISGDISGAIKFLLEARQQDYTGWTALMYAMKYKYKHIVAVLAPLESCLVSSAGELATDIALDNDFLEGATLTLRHEFPCYSNGLLSLALLEPSMASDWDGDLALFKALLRPSKVSADKNTELIRQLIHRHPNPSRFIKAAEQLEEATILLKQYVLHPAFEDEDGHTQLHVEAINGNLEGMRMCMHLARRRNAQGQTALMLAAAAGNIDAINLLMDTEGGLQDLAGLVATDYALDKDEYRAAAALLCCKEELERISRRGFTPLMAAVVNKDLELVKENICFCQAVYRGMYSALTLAIKLGDIDVIKLLRIEASITVGETLPWKLATELGLSEIASLIKPAIRSESGVTELHKAVMNNDQALAEELLHEAGATDPTGRTALIIAIEKGIVNMVAMLAPLEHSISFVGKWSSGIWAFDFPSPLLIATCTQREDICRILVQQTAGVSTTICDKNGLTPLMVAAGMGNLPLASLYYSTQKGMSDRSGNTALMWATKHSQSTSAALLCDEAGRLNLDGDCALAFALDRRDIKSISLLAARESRLLTKEFVSAIQDAKIMAVLSQHIDISIGRSNIREELATGSVGIKLSNRRSASTSLIHTNRMSIHTPSPSLPGVSASLVIREAQRPSSLRPLTPSFIFTKN